MNTDKKQNRNSKKDTGSKIFTKLNGMTPCPINNGADLKADDMLANLFDDGEYIENKVGDEYVALGFIGGVPARCNYIFGTSFLWVVALLKKKKCGYDSWKKILPKRLSDEQVYADLTYFSGGYWHVFFYYYD